MKVSRINGVQLTAEDILRCLQRYDREFTTTNDYERWLENAAYKYAVRHNGRLYPPKLIIYWASGVDRSEFNGGDQSNGVLRRLGFEVIDKPGPR